MRTPLEHKADVPEDEDREDGASGGKRGSAGAKVLRGAVEENAEAENEERRQRNEKTVAVRRNSRPVRVTSNEKVKGEECGEECSAGARLAPPEKEESKDGEHHGVGVIDVQHEACDQRENQPLRR